MKRKTQWLKWQDPMDWKEGKDPEQSGEQSTIDSFDADGEGEQARHVRMIAGPYGMIPMGEHGLGSKLYKLWVCHTNFDITKEVVGQVEKIEGVEILRVWTRYRMWVGIGNLFDTQAVQTAIDHALCGVPEMPPAKPVSRKQDAAVRLLEKQLKEEHTNEAWAICRLPDGRLWACSGTDRDSLIKALTDDGLADRIVSSSWEKCGHA